jgi:hypothetical protein
VDEVLEPEHGFGRGLVLELDEGEAERLLGFLVAAKLEEDDGAVLGEVVFEGGW